VRQTTRSFSASLFVVVLVGCVGPSTQLAPLPKGAVEAEERKERELALRENADQQHRLDSLAFPILAQSTSLCSDAVGPYVGLRVASLYDFEGEWREAARAGLELSDTLTVTWTLTDGPAARAGLLPGDRIVHVGEADIAAGVGARKAYTDALRQVTQTTGNRLSFAIVRAGQFRTAAIDPVPACNYGTLVIESDELNAFADGNRIFLTSTMMRFTNDAELSVVIAHEFAHNAMGHIKAQKKNSLFGALLGAMADVYMASQGVNTGGYYTTEYSKLAALAFSQDFEREADYVGIYALSLANLPLSEAPKFWRHMAMADPKSIELAYTHPTTAERFVRMEQAIDEVSRKREAGLALTPTMKRHDKQEAVDNQGMYAMGYRAAPERDSIATQAEGETKATPLATMAAAVGVVASATNVREPTAEGQPSPENAQSAVAAVAPSSVATPVSPGERPAEYVVTMANPRTLAQLQTSQGLRFAIEDAQRIRLIQSVYESTPGVLTVVMAEGTSMTSGGEYNLQRIYIAYSAATRYMDRVTLEIRQANRVVGWFSREGYSQAN
jgi:peptidase M48-like protein